MSVAKALAPVKVPPREIFSTKEGMRCVVAPRGQIPLVAVRLLIHGGAAADPPGLEGLTDFALRLLRRGTEKRSAEQIDEAVEFVGAALHAGSFEDYATLSVAVPTAHVGTLIGVLADLVRRPRFAPAEVAAARARTLAELANDMDDPGALADRTFIRALWGKHPYGHDIAGTARAVRRFTRKTVVDFYRRRVGPTTVTLHVVGPVDPGEVRRDVQRAFGGWRASAEAPPFPAEVTGIAHPGEVWIIDKPEQTQSQVRLGSLAYRRGVPDTHAAHVMNAALGGGFTSRLVNEVRVNRGLSYGVSSTLDPLQVAGTYSVSSFTKTESTRELLDVILEAVHAVKKGGLREDELDHAKRYLAGTYPLRTETQEAMAAALADVDFYGIGPDWIEHYRERLARVTLDEARAAAKRYLLSQPPAIVIVGRAKEVRKQVKHLGRVRLLLPGDDS